MKTQLLRTKSQQIQFSEEYARFSGNQLSLQYLQNASTRGFFDQGGLMIGGYVVNATPQLRYLQLIPAWKKRMLLDNAQLREHDMSEISCIWMDKTKINQFRRTTIYTYCILDAVRFGKTYVVGGSYVPKVARIQKKIIPNLLYSAPVVIRGKHRVRQIYYVESRKLVGNYIKGATSILVADFLESRFGISIKRNRARSN